MQDIIQISSVIISLISAIVSVIFASRARQDTKLQQRIELIALRRQYFSELRHWANEVVDTMTNAIFLFDRSQSNALQSDWQIKYFDTKAKLSALADRGRWFLPNYDTETHGKHKPSAYRGFRQPAIDHVVGAYNLLTDVTHRLSLRAVFAKQSQCSG